MYFSQNANALLEYQHEMKHLKKELGNALCR